MAHKTILLKGDPLQKEAKATAVAITPGFLLERTSAGLVQAHSTEDGDVAPILVAIENSLEGQDIDNNYAASDIVQFIAPRSGDEVLLYVADGQNITAGDLVSSNGDGYIKKYTAPGESSAEATTHYNEAIIGRALETKNTATSTVGASRIEVEIR